MNEVGALTTPDRVVYCDGSEEERDRLVAECLATGELIALNQERLPGCYLHRSAPHDVARTEHLTFICTEREDDAGPTNNWMAPADARARLTPLFAGAMRGRTMFVVPFLMGPPGSRFAKVGVEITDSRYVVLNMRIMTRMGRVALDHLRAGDEFTRCLHSLGDLSPDRRFIVHFPEENAVWSIGSGYGGNALLGKKCLALRLASWMAREEGWLAEHMLILGLRRPDGALHYVTGAFPSACGKTNLAMLVPPASMPGWKAWTVGDDIAWLRPGADGRLWAVNPEAGFFGVVPGTSHRTNPTAFDMIQRDTHLHQRRAAPRRHAVVGRARRSAAGRGARLAGPAVDAGVDGEGGASQQPLHDAGGQLRVALARVRQPGRRADLGDALRRAAAAARAARLPGALVAHGTFLGATLSSETTAAATGKVGVLRRDPMAMLPFCGYNMADYFQHWLDVGAVARVAAGDLPRQLVPHRRGRPLPLARLRRQPARAGLDSRSLRRTRRGHRHADRLRAAAGRDRSHGLDLSDAALETLLKVDPAEWVEAVAGQEAFLDSFGDRLPPALRAEHDGARAPHPRRDHRRPTCTGATTGERSF